MTRADRLRAYVDAAQNEPVVWGESDCSAWPARWVAQELGRPVMMPRYRSREEAHALIARAGSLFNLWRDMAARLGVFQTNEPKLGDVGLVAFSDRDVGGIFAHGGILLVRTDAGSISGLGPRKIIAAWAL